MSLLAGFAASAEEVRYPRNPQGDGKQIFVSDHGLVALSGNSADIVWRALTGVLTFEPVVYGNRVYVGASDGLYAFQRATGARLWRAPSEQVVYSPAAIGELVIAGGRDGSLRALDAETGDIVWRRAWDFWIYPPAVVGRQVVFGGAAHGLYAVERSTGVDLWQTVLDNELVYRPVAAGAGRVAATTFAGTIYMLDASDGEIIWTARNGVASRPPIFAANVALSVGLDGRLRARDVDSGHSLWSRRFAGQPVSAVSNVMFLIVAGSRIFALEPTTGRIAWTETVTARAPLAAVILDGRIVLVSADGQIHRLERNQDVQTHKPRNEADDETS